VRLGGRPITGPGLDRAVVFQQYALFPWRSAQANIEFGLEIKGVPRRRRAQRAREVLALVGLTAFADRYPHELSGGMKQRVAIARSLAYEPEVLLMDEPYAALDAQTRETLQDELLSIWRRTGTTILFITHAIDEAVYLGQRVAVMTSRPGRIKQIVDIDLPATRESEDPRSTREFVAHRRHIWELLHEEVRRSGETERRVSQSQEVVPA
jgi:NitT/TauT family transport system ATP-binding protein